MKTGNRLRHKHDVQLFGRRGKQILQTKQTICEGLEIGKCDGCHVKKNQATLGELGELRAHEMPP